MISWIKKLIKPVKFYNKNGAEVEYIIHNEKEKTLTIKTPSGYEKIPTDGLYKGK